MIRIVEYPTLKFSRIAAGIIKTKVIQLQLFLNQPSLSVRFRISINTMERRPQGNSKKVEGFVDGIDMVVCLR